MKIAATGHRPINMPCGYDETHPWALKIKASLKDWIETNNPIKIITGMALGWDTWVAEAALDAGVPIWCYIPFRGQGNKWPERALIRYQKIIERAEFVDITSDEWYSKVFLDRDERMVDAADYVLALHNPEITKGGTWHTIQYAMSKNKKITNLWTVCSTQE